MLYNEAAMGRWFLRRHWYAYCL